MSVKVAINGFGRIGRLAFRQMFGAEGYEVVAINDLTSPKMLAHLLKYDSTQGCYARTHEVEAGEDYITVDGKKVNMVEDNGSINAEAPLTVVNTSGFDLPQTGDHGTWMFTVGGIVLMASAMVMIFIAGRKKSNR